MFSFSGSLELNEKLYSLVFAELNLDSGSTSSKKTLFDRHLSFFCQHKCLNTMSSYHKSISK